MIQGAAYTAGRGAGLDMGDSLFWDDLSRNYTGLLADDLWGSAGLAPVRRRSRRDLRLLHEHGAHGPRRARTRGARCGGEFVRQGSLPVNTHGGLLAEGYLHGMNTVAEAALQLQGRAARDCRRRRDVRGHLGRAHRRLRTRAGGRPVIPPAGEIDATAFWAALDDGTLLVAVCGRVGIGGSRRSPRARGARHAT